MADLKDPQAYNIWDKERWSKKARLETAARTADADEARQFGTAKALQEMVNSGQLARLVEQFNLGEKAADSDVKRRAGEEETKYKTLGDRLLGVFGMTPEQRQTPQGRVAISLNAAGINAGNRGSRALGAAPKMETLGATEADAATADARAGAAESGVREIISNSMRPLAGQLSVAKTLKDIAGAGLFTDEAVMKQENLRRDRTLQDEMQRKQMELTDSQIKRNLQQGGDGTGEFKLPGAPAVIPASAWKKPAVAPAR